MSQLSNAINSYPVEHAIEFNEAYSLDPTITGSATRTSGNKFTLGGSSGAPVYYSNINPPGGSGSWLFPNQAGVDGASITTTSSISSTWADGDYSLGVWVMFPSLSETFSGTPVEIISLDMGGSAVVKMGLAKSGNDWKIARSINGGSTWLSFTPGTLIPNQWYYLSIGKASGGIQFAVDYWWASTAAFSGTGTGGSITLGHRSGDASAITYYLSNFYIGTATNIAAAAVNVINTAGSVRSTKSGLYNTTNSFNIQNGIEFDQGIVNPPNMIQTGTITDNTTAYWSFLGRPAVHQSSIAPLGGSASWLFRSDAANGSRLRNNGGAILTLSGDGDYSIGFWAKINTLRTSSTSDTAATIYTLDSTSTHGFSVCITGGAHATPNRISFNSTLTTTVTDLTVDTNSWYYFAVTKTGSNLNFYVNNELKATRTNMQNANASQQIWGDASLSDFSVNISNFYHAPTSVIGPTQIAQIWSAGSVGPSANIQETPATASALMTEPTIATTIGDHVEITTSIPVSAILPTDITVSTESNINIIITETLTASVEMINNVTVSTGTNESFSATEFIATAELVEPILSRAPMTASATMPGGTATVQANYYSLVKSLNPYLYIFDGKGTVSYNEVVNHGYQTGTFTKDLNLRTEQDAGNPLNLVGEGKSWLGPIGSSDGKFQFTTSTNAQSLNELVSTGTFAWEAWIKPTFIPGTVSDPIIYFVNGPIKFYLDRRYNALSDGTPAQPAKVKFGIQNSANNTFVTFQIPSANTPLSGNNWAHIVVQSYNDGTAGKRRAELWINGSRYITEQYSYSDWTSNSATATVFGSNHSTLFGLTNETFGSGQGIDEVAIYSQPLTNSQIVNHYNFISTLSPNVSYVATAIEVDADSGDHVVLAIDNVTIPETPVTATGLLVAPSVLAVKNISTSASALTASANNTDATVYWGWTIYETPAIAYAERPATYFLNDLYYQHVQANITPYRYLTFDSANAVLDYGTDTDYSVVNAVINGTIVNPDLGINGKSVKSTGTYTNGAAVLKESEHDDNWGTGNASWHSSFWMQRAIDDTSTGLRVLWNINGYADNQHIIIYHYQNKLHVQINNQSNAAITMSTANNVNIFDFNRHHIVLNSHHNNNQNTLTLYVDGAQVATQNIGTYAITTINGTPHTAPNDEVNNLPRLGVGALITPFGFTSLPVVPTNISVYFDEIYWDKNQIILSDVVSQFNAMPDKNNKIVIVETFVASDELVMPAFSTSSILATVPLTASVELLEPTVVPVRNLITTATVLTASGNAGDARVFEDRIITADVFVATATFNSAGVIITVPGGPMTASAFMRDDAVYLNDWNILVLTQTYKQMADAVSGVGTWMIGDVK